MLPKKSDLNTKRQYNIPPLKTVYALILDYYFREFLQYQSRRILHRFYFNTHLKRHILFNPKNYQVQTYKNIEDLENEFKLILIQK